MEQHARSSNIGIGKIAELAVAEIKENKGLLLC